MIGFRIGSYEFTEELGTGTFKTSFLAQYGRAQLVVARRLMDRFSGDDAIRGRLHGVSDLPAKIGMREDTAIVSGQKSSAEATFLLREHVDDGIDVARQPTRTRRETTFRNRRQTAGGVMKHVPRCRRVLHCASSRTPRHIPRNWP